MDGDADSQREVESLRARSAGEDPEDPYEDVDIESLPSWWQQWIKLFEEHDLRPYRPPRFEDGVLKHEIVEDLEAELGVEIRFRGVNATYGDDWEIYVDGDPVRSIGRRRSPDGYTVFAMESDEFKSEIRQILGS